MIYKRPSSKGRDGKGEENEKGIQHNCGWHFDGIAVGSDICNMGERRDAVLGGGHGDN